MPCRSVRPSVGPSVRPSVTFLNWERFLHYRSCPTVRDCHAMYPALFFFFLPQFLFVLLLLLLRIPASRLKSHHQGLNPSLKAQILCSKPKCYPQGKNHNLKAQIPASKPKSQLQSLNPCLIPAPWPMYQPKAQIPAARRRRRNFPMCESIGHGRLQGRSPAPSLNFTLLRLLFFSY